MFTHETPEGGPSASQNSPLTRRQSLRLVGAAIGGLALAGCASRRPPVGVGDATPTPPAPRGYPATNPSPAVTHNDSRAANAALERWNAVQGRASQGLPTGVITRTTWAGAGPALSLADPMGRIDRITIHHDGMSPFTSTNQRDAHARLESIRLAHRGQGWADIGYHFAIDPAGRVYQCRPLNLQGAHVRNQNPGNLGILLIGNFMDVRPTSDAMYALTSLLADRMRAHGVPARSVVTHRELSSTLCPGLHLQSEIGRLRARGGVLA